MDSIMAAVAASALSAEEKESVQEALADVKGEGLKWKKGRALQHCPYFRQYLTAKEWNALAGPSLRIAKVAQRCFSLGITCPTEPLVKVATLVATAFDREARESNELMKATLRRDEGCDKEP